MKTVLGALNLEEVTLVQFARSRLRLAVKQENSRALRLCVENLSADFSLQPKAFDAVIAEQQCSVGGVMIE